MATGPGRGRLLLFAESLERTVREVAEPLLAGLGYSLVELTIARLHGSTRVSVVIYRKEGVGVDECAEVSSMLFPRLETIDVLADPSLEVSSPGHRPRSEAAIGVFHLPGTRGARPGGRRNGMGERDHRPRGGRNAVAEKGKGDARVRNFRDPEGATGLFCGG